MELYSPISEKIKGIILERLANEYEAHFFYRNASNWCENIGYTKAAKFYEKEAQDELEHANMLQVFLNDWGVTYTIPSVSVTPKFNGLPDTIYKSYGIEVALYENYDSNAKEFMGIDSSTYKQLMKMVNIQYKSVAEYRTLVDKLALIVEDDKFQVFMFEKEVF